MKGRPASLIAPESSPSSNCRWDIFGWRGDTAAAHQVMREMTPTVDPASYVGPFPFNYFYVKAEFFRLRGQPARARAYSDSLLAALVDVYEERASDPNLNWYVGYAYAGLGNSAEAIRHADRAVSLLAESGNALRTAYIQPNVLWIYALAGDYDATIRQAEYLLSVPSAISGKSLRLEMFPAALREQPRFQALLERFGNN